MVFTGKPIVFKFPLHSKDGFCLSRVFTHKKHRLNRSYGDFCSSSIGIDTKSPTLLKFHQYYPWQQECFLVVFFTKMQKKSRTWFPMRFSNLKLSKKLKYSSPHFPRTPLICCCLSNEINKIRFDSQKPKTNNEYSLEGLILVRPRMTQSPHIPSRLAAKTLELPWGKTS